MNNWTMAIGCAAATGVILVGCAGDQSTGMSKTTSGALIGGGTGAVLGGLVSHGNAGAIVAGGLAGALLGGLIGKEMDARDREAREAALRNALQSSPNNQPKTWHNAKTGNSGSIKPLSGYTKSPSAQTCRKFTETYVKEGKTYEQTSQACRNANGEWALVNQ